MHDDTLVKVIILSGFLLGPVFMLLSLYIEQRYTEWRSREVTKEVLLRASDKTP